VALVDCAISDGVAFFTLNRPERLNACNDELLQTFLKLLYKMEADSSVRALHLTGAGRAFSSGFDMRDVPRGADGDTLHEHFRWMAMVFHEVLTGLVRFPKPVVAAVNGLAVGGGLGLALSSDMAIAGESATFLMSYTSIGLTPDATTTYHLPRYIGMRRALEWTYTNETLSAKTAAEWGLVNRVVPDSELLAYTGNLARNLAKGPTQVLGRTKQLFHGSWNETLETQAELEKQSIMWAVRQPAFQTALEDFASKRGKPAARVVTGDDKPK
jgi:enoyl-CoA hydratase/carnithine racemase